MNYEHTDYYFILIFYNITEQTGSIKILFRKCIYLIALLYLCVCVF